MSVSKDLLAKSYRLLLFDELDEYERAIEELTAHLAAHPRDGVAYNNRGLALSEIGRGEEALADFAMAISCSPNDPLPLINRGNLWERYKPAGKLDEAIADYTQAILIQDGDATIHRSRAHACLKARRFQDAVDSFTAAIRLDPRFKQTYLDRAQAYKELGESGKANVDLNHASKLP